MWAVHVTWGDLIGRGLTFPCPPPTLNGAKSVVSAARILGLTLVSPSRYMALPGPSGLIGLISQDPGHKWFAGRRFAQVS